MNSRILSFGAALLIALGANLSAQTVINGVAWSNVYDPDVVSYNYLPNEATPPWAAGETTGSASVIDHYLQISTAVQGQNQCYVGTNNWGFAPGGEMTVEMRFKLGDPIATYLPTANIRLGTNNYYIYLHFFADKVTLDATGSQIVANGLTLNDWTTMRLTVDKDQNLDIYTGEGDPIASLDVNSFTLAAGGTNNFVFGDIVSGSGGTSQWDYVAYTGGVHPIPEPGVVALLGGVAALGLALRTRGRKG